MDKHLKELEDKMTIARQDYSGPFCCFSMDAMIKNDDSLYNLRYDLVLREYYLESLPGPYIRTIEYCPWCGSQLPRGLRDDWFDILEQEYGLDDPGWPEQMERVPAEFLTDEWWKKRNL